MSFLFPAAWWLAGLALPVIAFYLLKTRQRRKAASTLIFWNQIKPKVENSPLWRKLRRWFSLFVQLLILALIVCALARPAFDWEKRNAQRVVAILDPSASMQATNPPPSRWVTANERLRTAVARLRAQDEMTILTAENPPRILSGWTTSQRLLRQAIDHSAALPTGTDPSPALYLARELTATRDGTRIEMFSDSVWPQGSWSGTHGAILIRGVDEKPPLNAGLTLFAARRSPIAPGDWQLDAEITATAVFSGTVEILKDGTPMDLAIVEASPEKPWRKSWRGSSETGAKLEARLATTTGDMLPSDNIALCELQPLKPLVVLVTGPEDPFLQAVLNAIPLVEWAQVARFPNPVPTNVDLVIASGKELPQVAAATPLLLINPEQSGFWGQRAGTLDDTPVTDLDKKSALLRHTSLNSVSIQQAGKWTPADGAEVLASSMGNALLFGQWDRGSRWLVMGFNPEKSDLPLRTAFPIFISNLLQSLRADSEGLRGAAVLPGHTESALKPLAKSEGEESRVSLMPNFPGWWLALAVALAFLTLEWFCYSRRITD